MTQAVNANYSSGINPNFYTKENAERTMQFLENNNLKVIDADTFENLKDLADKIEVDPNSKIQGPLKAVLTAVAIAGASALTASAVTGRGLAFLSKNTNIIEKVSKFIMDLLDKTKKHLKNNPNLKLKNFKGMVLRFFESVIKKIEKFSKSGIDDTLKNIKGKGSKAKKTIEQGKNLIEKTIKGGAAVIVGGKTLQETTEDKDQNGIADFQDKKGSDNKQLKEALTEAIINTAV